MKLIASSELMDNYKQMKLAEPEKVMQNFSDDTGRRILSIGTDGTLYLTSEQQGSAAGWQKTDFGKSMRESCPGKSVEVKSFDARIHNGKYTVAAVVRIDGKENLLVSSSKKVDEPCWKNITFDLRETPPEEICAVYLPLYETEQVLICDVMSKSRPGFQERYMVDCDKKHATRSWNKKPLPADFGTTKRAVIGRRASDKVDGIYTLGILGGESQLLYTPLYNRYDPDAAPAAVRFQTHGMIDEIALLSGKQKSVTHLFACGDGKLWCFPADKQKDLGEPVLLCQSAKLTEVRNLYAYEAGERICVSGNNENGHLFFCSCKKENWEQPEAWSSVLTLDKGIAYADCFWNQKAKSNSYIAVKKDGNTILLGQQSSHTSLWSVSQIALPSPEGAAVKFPSYTTRLTVADDNGKALAAQEVSIQASEPCGVYINGLYYFMGKEPITAETGADGTILIIQTAQTLSAVRFVVSVFDHDLEIDPGKKAADQLLTLNSAEDLRAAKVNGSPLVEGDITDRQLDAAGAAIAMLRKSMDDLPANGRRLLSDVVPLSASGVLLTVSNGRIQSAEMNSNSKIMLTYAEPAALGGYRVMDELADIFQIIADWGEELFEVAITCAKGFWEFVVTIGEEVYSFFLDCAEKVLACAEKIFSMIKVGVEKLIRYLSYLFDWDDIQKVQNVLKQTFNQGLDRMIAEAEECKDKVHELIDTLTARIDQWAGIEHIDVTGELYQKYGKAVEVNAADAILLDHFKENAPFTEVTNKNAQLTGTVKARLKVSLEEVIELALMEGDVLLGCVDRIREELLDSEKLEEMELLTICKKLAAILADTALYSFENVIRALLDSFRILFAGIKELMNYEIHIPVVSDILNDVFGIAGFSLLDLFCLIPAVIAAPVMKLTTGRFLLNDDVCAILEDFGKKETAGVRTASLNIAEKLPTTASCRDAYAAMHIIGGICNLCETVLYPFAALENADGNEAAMTGASSMVSIAEIIFAAGDGICYFTAFCIYQPCTLNKNSGIRIAGILAGCVKYGGLALKLLYKLNRMLKKEYIGEKGLTGGQYMQAAGACLCILQEIWYMVEVSGEDKFCEDEKKLLYLDNGSLLADNLRVVLDNIISNMKNGKVKLIMLGVRSFFSVAYSSIQIAEGSISVSMETK